MSSDLKVVTSAQQEENESNETAKKEDASAITEAHPELEDSYLGGDYSSSTIKKLRESPESIGKLFKEGKYPYTNRIDRAIYETEKKKLQIELLKVQNWVKMTGQSHTTFRRFPYARTMKNAVTTWQTFC